MAGFLGLFGGKKEDKEAFFLDTDESKSMGDIDYMRTPNTVRRTFAKKAGETEHKEFIQEVTAMGREVASQSADEFKPKERKRTERKLVNEKNYQVYGGGSLKTAGTLEPGALKDAAVKRASTPSVSEPVASEPAQSEPSAVATNRSADPSMDMFRNMVKDMKQHG